VSVERLRRASAYYRALLKAQGDEGPSDLRRLFQDALAASLIRLGERPVGPYGGSRPP